MGGSDGTDTFGEGLALTNSIGRSLHTFFLGSELKDADTP
jgi:hypothetical protein